MKNIHRHIGIAAFAAVLLFAGACKANGLNGLEGVGDSRDTILAQQAAKLAVLIKADLPIGWTGLPPEADPDIGFEFSEACALFNAETVFPDSVATQESNEFTGPLGQQVSSDAEIFKNDEAAVAAFDEVSAAISRCRDELLPAFEMAYRQGFEQGGGDLTTLQLTVTFEELDYAVLGDGTYAYRLAGNGSSAAGPITFTVDFVTVRVSRIVGGLVYASFGAPDMLEQQTIADKIANKLTLANGTLPAVKAE